MSFSTENSKSSKNFSHFIEKLSFFPHSRALNPEALKSSQTQASSLLKKSEMTYKKLGENANDSTVNYSFNNSSTVSGIDEILPKALTDIEHSINKLKKCYFSLYKRGQKANRSETVGKMDVDTIKKAYFECFHRESNDITELYNFYREQAHLNESNKAKTFRNSSSQRGNDGGQKAGKYSGSALKSSPAVNNYVSPKENESFLSQQLRKICKANANPNLRSEKTQSREKLSLSVVNKSLFNQKLNFINLNLAPTTSTNLLVKSRLTSQSNINAQSLEKITKKPNNSHNNSIGKINDVERRRVEIERIISPNTKKSRIFSTLPVETQQRILLNNRKIADFNKIREIAKLLRNYQKPNPRSSNTRSEVPSKLAVPHDKLAGKRPNTSQIISSMESFFDKSEMLPEPQRATVNNWGDERLRNEDIDERSFLEGLKHAADYNNFLGKDMSNDPSFNFQSCA